MLRDTILDPRKFTIDAGRWPIVIITQLTAQLTDDERVASLDQADQLLDERPGRYAMVLDNRRAEPPPAKQRALIAEYGVRAAERMRLRCIGTALIVSSDVMRAMITAVQWQTGRPTNTQVFEDLAPALAWTQERIRLDRK